MKVYDGRKAHPLSDGQGGTVFAVENGKGSFELVDNVEIVHRPKGDPKKRKAQKNARKRNRK